MTPEIAALDEGMDTEPIDMDELSAKDRRAVRARSESMVVVPQTDPDGECIGMYDVHSESGAQYTVILDHEDGCNCSDMEYNNPENCKHRRRVAIAINESDCPAPGQQLGDYGEVLEEVEEQLENERERILDELDTVTAMMDGIEAQDGRAQPLA